MPTPDPHRPITTATLSIVLSVLLPAGCAVSDPAPAPAPAAITSTDDNALVGDWMTAITAELELPTRMLLHISKGSDGQLHVSNDNLTMPEKDEPLKPKSIAFERGVVSIDIDGGILNGTLDPDRSRIQGSFKVTGALNKLLVRVFGDETELPLVMTRIDPAHPPRRLQSRDYTIEAHHIHYLEVAGSPAARIVFIHGSPGGAEDWNPYLTDPALQQRATLIAADRPGFGQSDPGHVVTSLREQAHLLEPLLHEQAEDDHEQGATPPSSAAGRQVATIVVGWSEGGPIAAEMAMDFPDQVQAALLEAPAIDPEHDGAQWYNYAAAFWPIGKLVAGLMGDSLMWSNQEMMVLEPQLQAMAPRWQSLKMPVVVIQGGADGLVDPRTADFAQRVLPSADWIIRVPGAGHGVPFTKTALAALNRTLTDLTTSQRAVTELP